MTRQYSRRATLTVVGAGLAGLTGALAPRDCLGLLGGADCGSALSLTGPDAVALAADATDPRFVLENQTDDAARVTDATWTVYQRGRDWKSVASDQSGGVSARLAPDEQTAWALLVRAENNGYTVSTTDATTASSTTRYVGPVSLSRGPHAFVVSGRVDGARFEAGTQFAVE
ncbi:hypothetical protein [Halobacterium zhouii]|uniref:hypothetical protein n=1 Tax=Halobacterium zhouii TaxID=2902624 RepID=UPI001E38FD75|nr:hypothetical protein [Halobacterium zhouii]